MYKHDTGKILLHILIIDSILMQNINEHGFSIILNLKMGKIVWIDNYAKSIILKGGQIINLQKTVQIRVQQN